MINWETGERMQCQLCGDLDCNAELCSAAPRALRSQTIQLKEPALPPKDSWKEDSNWGLLYARLGQRGGQKTAEKGSEHFKLLAEKRAETMRKNPKGTARIPIPKEMRMRVFKEKGTACFYCERELNFEIPRMAQIDHLVQVIYGGTNEFENLVPCCMFCNVARGDMSLEQFREYMKMRGSLPHRAFKRWLRAKAT